MRLLFAGTPEFAARHLAALLASHHEVCAVYTQPDRPAGRGKKISSSPVKDLALAHHLPVIQPLNLKSALDQQQLASFAADVMVVVAYGVILPRAVLVLPRFGCINVHGSILPRWRGAAPIQRAIEAGDEVSGVTIMQMDEGLDTGAMLLKATCPILPNDTAADLHDRLAEIGPLALLETLDALEQGCVQAEVQDNSQSTYAKKIDKAEAEIDWGSSAKLILRKIRAFYPAPGCFTHLNGERCRILSASLAADGASSCTPGSISCDQGQLTVACGVGRLVVTSLQLAGKKAMSGRDFLNGFGESLSSQRFSHSGTPSP